MSRLLDNIQTIDTRTRRAKFPFFKVSETIDTPSALIRHTDQSLYKFEATFGTECWSEPRFINLARKASLRALEDEIFGEFRRPLMDAQNEAYQGNYDEVLNLLNKLEKDMFSVT